MHKTCIKAIIAYLVDNVEELSTHKFTGVSKTRPGVYRTYKGAVIPKILDTNDVNEVIAGVVNELYQQNSHAICRVVWDGSSGWFTIYKG